MSGDLFGVRRQSEAATALCSGLRVYAAAARCDARPKGGNPKHPKRRRRRLERNPPPLPPET
ncbi:MAG: hypothetical protein ACXW3C_18710, partial [Pyrinomonadaceae bacterium]